MEDFKDNFKEIEGLLETTVNPEPVTAPRRIKKFIKLVLPHVALVITVCVYASLGAWIFYTLESPNEDSLKEHGKHAIGQMRGSLIQLIKEGRGMKKNWKESVEKELYRFNDNIYKAYKEQYVRYPDVKVALRYDISDEKEDGDRTKRHRNSRTRERGEKLWTASSALFFAATTMATIGYGNIVPATSGGRIACVLFALIGAPLAIITIGDLGKFLSECTIWLYKQMKKAKEVIRRRWRRFRIGKGHLDDCEMQSVESQKPKLNWEDLDKSEVPVLMVFTILLMYIAFGGILFSFLEGWSYMDAFYYSFISLTTIGFGDIVPENHDYIILMLIYLGVGLAVTTMCIDLVGIQYIQKIHYFGRKFRGTDLLQLLKRKRMLERRLAMGQGEEILQFYMQEMQSQMPEPVMVEEPQWPPEPLKTPSPTEWLIDDSLMTSRHSYTYPLAEQVPSPNVLSIRSFRLPSIYSNSSASARSLMHLRLGARGGSWDESGPSLSEHCSLSTEPSVHIRQAYWDEFRSPDPSVTSFAFDFPLPSPDYSAIAREARSSRRLNSCPPDPPWPPSHSNSVSSQSARAENKAHEGLDRQPVLHPLLSSFRIPEPFMLSNLAALCDMIDAYEDALRFQSPRGASLAPKPTSPPPLSIPVVNESGASVHVPRLAFKDSPSPPPTSSGRQSLSSSFRSSLFPIFERRTSYLPPETPTKEEAPEPLLKRKKRERIAKQNDPLQHVDWLNISPRSTAMKLVKDDLPTLFSAVRRAPSSTESTTETNVESPSIVLVSPRNPVGLACMEDWDSYIRMLEEYEKPYERMPPSPIPSPPAAALPASPSPPPTLVDLSPSPLLPSPLPSPLPSLPHTPSPKLGSPLLERESPVPSPPLPSQSVISNPPCRCYADTTPISSSLISEVASVHGQAAIFHRPGPLAPASEFLFLETRMPLVIEESEEPTEQPVPPSPMIAESSSEDEGPSGFDLDLGAFELVDSGLSAETLLSAEEPVIFHQDMPVHSVHHDTVQTEAALANLMSAPAAMLTAAIPPVMVEDNYCFVVDGERVKMGDILGDDQWWRHTSRPTKYFYSEDLRQFHRVNCITAKGKVIAAKLVSGTIQVQAPSSASTTPRSSVSGTSSRAAANNNKVPLCHVYKVIRFYSFWKTCTSFHRIVTMIDKVSNDDRHMNPDFKKRLFVQYLWRNAKAVEKARVQKEFDPRRQRLLRFVTDPNARKRFNKMFVEDDSCTFAVIVDDTGLHSIQRGRLQRIPNIDRDESEDSTIDFPVQVNALPVRKHATEEEVLLHYGHEDEPIPVFSVGELPLDGPSTLNNIIHCPVKYISKTPPSLVVDNYCFICDGDEVSEEDILKDQQWWKQTSCTTRFYSSENLTTFHQVTLLQCRGEMRGAYRTKERGGGLTKVSLSQVFRVSRFFSCWKTCHSFHRIVSVISPVTEQGEVNNNFKKRIFIQYFWRQERQQDRELVQREYLEQQMRMKVSPRHSLVPPSTSYRTRAQYPSSSSSMSSFDSTSPRHSTIKEESKWRILNRVYQTKKAFMSNRRALAPPRDNK